MTLLDDDTQDQIAERLADAGLSPEFISHVTEAPLQRVRGIVATRRTRTYTASEADEKITNEVQRLAMACLKQAFLTVEFGPSEPRNQIVKTMLSGMVRSVTAGQSSETEEMRVALTALFSDMTDVPSVSTLVTETDILDVAATTALEPVDDQDEGSGVPPPQH